MFRTASRLALIATAFSCATESPAGAPAREILPNGATLIRYPDLPTVDSVGPDVTDVLIDLQLGSREGDDPTLIFADIRGIQAASDGTIYVLDYLAVEVRAYRFDGRFLRTVARLGEGPGEILNANGILLSGDTLLWMNDRVHRKVIGVDPTGEEVHRSAWPIPGYGYYWDGAFDRQGRYWTEIRHSNDENKVDESGPYTNTARAYYKSYDLSTEEVDSVYMGESTYRRYAMIEEWRASDYLIPFDSSDIHIVNPSGGFWMANTGSYRLTRTDEDGDTLLVIEASLSRFPVTAEDRAAYVQSYVERNPEERPAAETVAELMPDFKPVLEALLVDDEGRLWVERVTPRDIPPFYDLFSQDGDYLGSVRFGFTPAPNGRRWIQHGAIYTWILDDVGVQYVVRAPVP